MSTSNNASEQHNNITEPHQARNIGWEGLNKEQPTRSIMSKLICIMQSEAFKTGAEIEWAENQNFEKLKKLTALTNMTQV